MGTRYNSVDLLRVLAIIFMIEFHLLVYWSNLGDSPIRRILLFIGSLAAPNFLIVSGISYFLFMFKNINEGLPKSQIFKTILKRSAFIFIISTLFQLAFGRIFDMTISFILYWSLFQVIAFAMILFFILLFLIFHFKIIGYFLIMIFVFILNFIIVNFNLELLFFLVSGAFEIISWVNFFIFGLFIGDLLVLESGESFNKKLISLITIGLIIFIQWILLFLFSTIDTFLYFFILRIWIFMIFFVISYYLLDLKKIESLLTRLTYRWSKLAFSIYYIQFAIIGIGIIFFPFIINESFLSDYLIYKFIILFFLVIIIIEIILQFWRLLDYRFGIEWLMNLFINKSLFSNKINNDQKKL